jgi:DNA-directed RNA polymerase II subunit RPB2
VDENSHLILSHSGTNTTDLLKRYSIHFGQIYLSKPTMTESDGSTQAMFPQEARSRNLTYAAPLFVDMKKTVAVADPSHPSNVNVTDPSLMYFEEQEETEEITKVFIGKVPIMVKSTFCILNGLTDKDLHELNECPYDQGGYFIINGSEKVIIAQERMAANQVYCFSKAQPSPFSFSSEIRSAVEKKSKNASPLYIKLMRRGEGGGGTMRVSIPYIRQDIPVVIVFRALGIVADKDIIEHICYDSKDNAMLEMLKPCIEEAFVIQDQEVALDFIGKRGTTVGVTKEKRIK